MTKKSVVDHRSWLSEALPKHERLAVAVTSLLENLLKKKEIEYLSVESRIKSIDGALEKINRKQYSNPQSQLTDLSGIRVITYLEQNVEAISRVVRELFEVDESNSLDRSEVLGDDRVGYRSTHFVCSLGKKREGLPEYESLGKLCFEIQVRTVLQHAWAELAHDRSFKFGATLPTKIQRKLNLYAGMLEIVDTSFDSISKEIDTYKRFLDSKTVSEIDKVEVDSISLDKFVSYISRRHKINIEAKSYTPTFVRELKDCGITTVGDLKRLTTASFLKAYKAATNEPRGSINFIRLVLVYNDIRHLDNLRSVKRIWPEVIEFLSTKHGKSVVERKMSERGIVVATPARAISSTERTRKK